MSEKRQIEIFSAGCPVCRDIIDLVNRLACASCEISVLDMNDKQVANRAAQLGIKSIPAVAVNGTLADCCAGRGVDENTLRSAGIGQPLR
jgi:thioredoxin-like negative regulator of GroEL